MLKAKVGFASLGGVTDIPGRAGSDCEKSKKPGSMESLENDFQVFLSGWRLESIGEGYGGRGKKLERRGERKDKPCRWCLFAKGFASAMASFLCQDSSLGILGCFVLAVILLYIPPNI